ncbi:cache domain-containing protein [Micrococcaceae bacterium Sec5.1]
MRNNRPPAERGSECSAGIGALFANVFSLLGAWRTSIEQAGNGESNVQIDSLVYSLVEPELTAENPLLIGAGFISAPKTGLGQALHFAWWLGPLQENPLLGTTTTPSRLDLASREYTEYLRDFRAFEWYRIPAATRSGHITGPYVDHLCTCDYILTITVPVGSSESVQGVVGVDILVRRLEQELMPLLRRAETAVALVSSNGRVILSVSPALRVGSMVSSTSADEHGWKALACPGTEFSLLMQKE